MNNKSRSLFFFIPLPSLLMKGQDKWAICLTPTPLFYKKKDLADIIRKPLQNKKMAKNQSIIENIDLKKMSELTFQDLKNDESAVFLTPKDYQMVEKAKRRIQTTPWSRNEMYINERYSIEEVFDLITSRLKDVSLKVCAALILLYLSGSRIGEIIGNKFKDGTVWNGVRQKDIRVIEDKRGSVLMVRTIIQKHYDNYGDNLKKKYKFKYKYAYIPISEMYKPFIDVLQEFSDSVENDDPELPLFEDINYEHVANKMRKNVLPCGVHVLRHWRATHLVQYHGYTESDLRLYFGWSKESLLPTRYTHQQDQVLIDKGWQDLSK